MILSLLAVMRLAATITVITLTIPKNHASDVVSLPGTGTFIPNNPQIRFSGTRIVAITVILLSVLFVWLPLNKCSTFNCAK